MSKLNFFIKENTLTVVSGEQSINKTVFAINAAVDYIEKTGKSVILLLGKYPSFYIQKMTNEIPAVISEKIYILTQLYQYRDELSLINYLECKIVGLCDVGLVIMDDDSNFIMNKKTLLEYRALLTRQPISILIISNSKSRKRKFSIGLYKGIKPIYFKMANEVYRILQNDGYFKNGVKQLKRIK